MKISADELFELEIKKAQYALGDKKMNIDLRVYDKYINVEVSVGDAVVDLSFHDHNDAKVLLGELESAVDELKDMIEAIEGR